MAQNKTVQLLILGAGALFVLETGRTGQLPQFLQMALHDVAPGTFPAVPGITTTTTTTPPSPGGGGGGTTTAAGAPPPIFGPSALEMANPNIIQQANDWRQQRWARGENWRDWAAFRTHELAIGAPDPGAGVALNGW